METAGAVADYDEGAGKFTIYSTVSLKVPAA
jgi:hypothetical protein